MRKITNVVQQLRGSDSDSIETEFEQIVFGSDTAARDIESIR